MWLMFDQPSVLASKLETLQMFGITKQHMLPLRITQWLHHFPVWISSLDRRTMFGSWKPRLRDMVHPTSWWSKPLQSIDGLQSKGWVAVHLRCGGKPNDETLREVRYLHAKAAGTAQRITSFLALTAFSREAVDGVLEIFYFNTSGWWMIRIDYDLHCPHGPSHSHDILHHHSGDYGHGLSHHHHIMSPHHPSQQAHFTVVMAISID